MTDGIIKIYLKNRKVKEYLGSKEQFVTLNSFVKNPNPGKNKIRVCNDIILLSDIGYVEWEGANS